MGPLAAYGGTWAGASEQLEKFHYALVFVRAQGEPTQGLSALRERGAISWPEPQDVVSFNHVFENLEAFVEPKVARPLTSERVIDLFSSFPQSIELDSRQEVETSVEKSDRPTTSSIARGTKDNSSVAANALFSLVSDLLLNVEGACISEFDAAEAVDVLPAQARHWLERLVKEGTLVKQGNGTYKHQKL